MFYSQFILAKKGPLATIWIAAHLERKLRKNQITDTNIGESVDSILYPEVPIALRLSGHLLLGVVRIYSRKVNLLFNDCSEALVKIHQAFQSSAVDLPPGAVVAPFNSITLPESFDFDDLETHLNREILAAQIGNRNDFEHHVTARDLITLQEQNDDRKSLFSLDERFEDVGNPYAVLDLSLEELAPQKPLQTSVTAQSDKMPMEDDVLPPLPMDDEMDYDGMNVDRDDANLPGVIEPDVRREAKVVPPPFTETTMGVPDVEKLRAASDPRRQEHVVGLDDDENKETPISMDVDDRVASTKKASDSGIAQNLEEIPLVPEAPTPLHSDRAPTPLRSDRFSPVRSNAVSFEGHDVLGSILGKRTPKLEVAPTPASVKRVGKKRKEAFDGAVALSSTEMKKQLKSANDICRVRRRAPSTEYDIWMSKRDDHFEQRFSEPSFPGFCDEIRNIFEDVISQRIPLRQKARTPDQVSSRRTSRRLDPDGKGKMDNVKEADTEPPNVKEADTEPPVQAAGIEIVAPPMPSLADELVENVEDANGVTGQREEAHSPDPDFAFAPPQATDEEGFDAAREQDEGVSFQGHLDSTVAKNIREHEDTAAANAYDHDENGELRPQGLAFLADPTDPRDADELDMEMSAIEQTGRSTSNDSGWSSRSRAVAMYFKEQFKIESNKKTAQKDQTSLTLEKLLSGRTRREASRLFFETLVLGSKGYIQVEQACPYADVRLIATRRLLKAAF